MTTQLTDAELANLRAWATSARAYVGDAPSLVLRLLDECKAERARADAEAGHSDMLDKAIGTMTATCLRVLLEKLPADAELDRHVTAGVLARVEAAREAHAARRAGVNR